MSCDSNRRSLSSCESGEEQQQQFCFSGKLLLSKSSSPHLPSFGPDGEPETKNGSEKNGSLESKCDKPLKLDLDNFQEVENIPEDCSFVLTSPTSLEACNRLGVKVRADSFLLVLPDKFQFDEQAFWVLSDTAFAFISC